MSDGEEKTEGPPSLRNQIIFLVDKFSPDDPASQEQAREISAQVINQMQPVDVINTLDFVSNQLVRRIDIPEEQISDQERARFDFLEEIRLDLLNHCFSLGEEGRGIVCGELLNELLEGSEDAERRVVLRNIGSMAQLLQETIVDCQDYQEAFDRASPVFESWLQQKGFRTEEKQGIDQ